MHTREKDWQEFDPPLRPGWPEVILTTHEKNSKHLNDLVKITELMVITLGLRVSSFIP